MNEENYLPDWIGKAMVVVVVVAIASITWYCIANPTSSGVQAAKSRTVIKNVADQAKELDGK